MMEVRIRKIIPNSLINIGKHLPEAFLANLVYGFPSRGMKVIGVTGTDGKTTTVNMIYHVLKEAGYMVAMISTVKAMINDQKIDTGFHVTSPLPFDLGHLIKKARQNKAQYLILEVSSFALAQYRVFGIKFDIGVITNITHEHLDYHKTWEDYFLSKVKLIKKVKISVLPFDDPSFPRLKRFASGRVISFGTSKAADYNPNNFKLQLRLPGQFNILNALAAGAVCVSLGLDQSLISRYLNNFETVSGRMEEIQNQRGFRIFVDYAHTPNGLKQALETMRQITKNKLIAIIGAEGQRDEGKRSLMGSVAAKMADIIVVTAVDPRGLLDEINIQILEGIKPVNPNLEEIYIENDRQKAIELTINKLAKKGDVVGIFGKGHETSMNLDGKIETPWSDQKVIRQVLDAK